MKVLSVLLLFIISLTTYSQELPPIEKFTPEEYGGENQNWMISQTSNNYIYVANNKGLLEFNGSKWKMTPPPNNTIIRAVNVVDDENIWNILSYEKWIIFQSQARIYLYNTLNDKFKVINSENIITKVFNIDNTLLVVGTFMDMTPAILIFTPIFLPVVTKLGMHPVHFGIVMVLNLSIGLCTPPVGTILFVGSGIAGGSVSKVIKPLLPFLAIMIIVLLLIVYIPEISMILPRLFEL